MPAIDIQPRIISIGNLLSFEQAHIPSRDGKGRLRGKVGIADNCKIINEVGGLEFDQMIWIANERLSIFPGIRRQRSHIRDVLPTPIVLYVGRALNKSDINGLSPFNHRGLWLRRKDVWFDNE